MSGRPVTPDLEFVTLDCSLGSDESAIVGNTAPLRLILGQPCSINYLRGHSAILVDGQSPLECVGLSPACPLQAPTVTKGARDESIIPGTSAS